MSSQQPTPAGGSAGESTHESEDFVSMTVHGQLFGIPVLTVQDVLGPQTITRVPLGPPEVAGTLNLRGRIVTAIDLRKCLNLPEREEDDPGMSVVVHRDGELYSLIVDSVGEVLSLPDDRFERNPATLDERWRQVSAGVYRLDDQLLIVFDVARLLNFGKAKAA